MKKLYICYKKNSAPCGNPCRIFGLDANEKPTDGWAIHAVLELDAPPSFAEAILSSLNDMGVPYSDISFSADIDASATAALHCVKTALATDTLIRLPYSLLTNIWRTDEWVEVKRRVVILNLP